MWFLTSSGPALGGKRLWLRPGTTHLLGRTSGISYTGERLCHIDSRSVSRKHLSITLHDVNPGDSARVHVRSKITLKDCSKLGSSINGERMDEGAERTLEGSDTHFSIRLGRYEHVFNLEWKPVTITYTSTSKKSKIDIWREKLESSDVKVLKAYVSNETSHVVVKKRNTPAGLQGLVQARWLVTDGWAEALVGAVEQKVPDPASDKNISGLEQDFDANWPSEMNFIVPPAGEPSPQPAEMLKPRESRLSVFEGFSFIFMDPSQYETLLPVVTSGGGKALLREIEPGTTSVTELVDYVKQVAGRKDEDQFSLNTGGEGVVVIRLNEKTDEVADFEKAVERATGQHTCGQNQFLEAILTENAENLRQPLKRQAEEDNLASRSRISESPVSAHQQPRSPAEEQQRLTTDRDVPPSAQPNTSRSFTPARNDTQRQGEERPGNTGSKYKRKAITSRFQGFDDFDPTSFAEPELQPPGASRPQSAQAMDVDEPSQTLGTQKHSRKRPPPVEEPEKEEDMYANILTGHAAMKRQKTEQARKVNGQQDSTRASVEPDNGSKLVKPKKKKQKEMDVLAEVQAARKREEEAREKDEESLRQALDGVDISDLKNLAQVEEMPLAARTRPDRSTDTAGRSDRWDPAWNGRKNFKRFRPQGQRGDTAGPRLRRVIVTLEEAPRHGRNVEDDYLLPAPTAASTSTRKSRHTQTQSQTQTHRSSTAASRSQRRSVADSDDDDEANSTAFQRRLQRSHEEDTEHVREGGVLPEEVAGHARDEGWEAATGAAPGRSDTPSQTFGTESQRRARDAEKGVGKRGAEGTGGVPAAKRAKGKAPAAPVMIDEDDDEDDQLKFRRKRR